MRTENRCECPKCGYKFIDISEGYFRFGDSRDDKINGYYAEVEKLKKDNKWCSKHCCEIYKGKCKYCELEKEMNG